MTSHTNRLKRTLNTLFHPRRHRQRTLDMSPSNLLIYYDDLTDSDNWVAARFLQAAAAATPSTRVKWIVEPRQVSLGLEMTPKEVDECQKLLEKHFKKMGNPFKVLLGGRLDKSELDKVEGLTAEERRIVSLSSEPAHLPSGKKNHQLTDDAARVGHQAPVWSKGRCHTPRPSDGV